MLNKRIYNLCIGLCLFYGFVANYVICKYFGDFVKAIDPVLFLVSYFILAIVGIIICKKSSSALISFVGYNLVVVPVGAAVSLCLEAYRLNPEIIIRAAELTAIVTLALTAASVSFPSFFLKLGRVLFLSLLLLIVAETVLIFTGREMPTAFEFIGCGIFCGYIGYDIVIAQEIEPTIDNAVDMAVGLYLDIINLFLRILRILAKSKK